MGFLKPRHGHFTRPQHFIRAYLWEASFGTRLSGVYHGPIIVLVMARVR